MLRTALGESTASLDSTVRSSPAAPSLSPGLGVGPALGASAGVVIAVPCHVSGSLVGTVSHVLGESCVSLGDGAQPTLPISPGTKGARSSACPLGRLGAAMGSQICPLCPRAPRSPTVRVPRRCSPICLHFCPPGASQGPPRGPWVTGSPWSLPVCPTAHGHQRTSFGEVSATVSPSENQQGSSSPQMPGTQRALPCPWQEARPRPEPLSLLATCRPRFGLRQRAVLG